MNEYDELISEENEYDQLIKDEDAARTTSMRTSLAGSKGTAPDQQAKIIDLASRAKLPTDVVSRNLDAVQAKVEANEYDQLIQDSPDVAEFLSKPENAAVGKDDIGALSRISGALGRIVGGTKPPLAQAEGLAESLGRTPETITKTLLTDPLIEATDFKARPRKSIGGVTDSGYTDPITGEFHDQGYQDSRRYFEAAPSFEKDLNTIARGINESLKVDAEISGKALPESVQQQRATPGVNTAKILDNLGQMPAYAVALFAPGKAAERTLALTRMTQAERAVIAGAASNSAIIGSQTYNDAYQSAYDNYISLGMHPEEAAIKAQFQAKKAARIMRGVALVTGAFGEGQALATTSLKAIPKAAFTGAATELPEELAQSAIVKAAAGEHLTQDEAIEVGVLATILGGGVNTSVAGVNVAVERQRSRSNDSVKTQASLDAIAAAAQESKLLPRSPEKFKEAVRDMGQKSGQEAVYIPVEQLATYYQSKGIDPGAEIAILTGNAEAYQEALETGADIKIPIESFAANIAPLHYEGLKPHIRTDPDALTPAEAAEFEEKQEEIAAGLVDTDEEIDTVPQVYESVLTQLVDAGFETKAAENQAKLYSSMFRSMAQRTGLDPVTLYNRYGLTVSRADMPTKERRVPDEKRKIIEKLPPAERMKLLKSDVIPALKSKRAFEMHVEQNPKDRILFFDLDDFKTINDRLDEEETDYSVLAPAGELIEEVAQAVGIQAFHRSGDEFLAAGATDEQLDNFAKTLRERLKSAKFIARLPDGRDDPFTGIGFSYGIEGNYKSARQLAKKQKIARREAGERIGSRDSGGMGEKPPAGNEVSDRDSQTALNQSSVVSPTEIPGGLFEVDPSDLWTAARDWYSTNLQGRTVLTPDQSEVRFSKQGKGKSLSRNRLDPLRMSVVKALPELVKTAPIYDISKDRTGKPDVEFAYAAGAITHEGKAYPVRLTYRVSRQGDKQFYDFSGYDMDPGAVVRDRTPEGELGAQGSPGSELNIGDLVKAFNEKPLFQPPPLDGVARGQISFNKERTRFSILLFKNADLSTLLHESGHFYLEVLGDLVSRGEADSQMVEDYKAILKWTGNTDGNITRNQHEQIARGFEAYLMEGKAPSPELQGAFARFRSWMIQIYRSVRALDVELSDEIRQVFDRLVATDDEIIAVEQEMDYRVVFGDNPVLMKIAREAREAAQTKIANQIIKDVTRTQKNTWKENRKKVMSEIAARVDSRPVYQVLAYLGKGTLPDGSPLPAGTEVAKLSKKALLEKYEQDWITRNLFKKRVYTTDGGVDPESLAPVYGFESGDAMVRAIAAAEPREVVIERETEERMKKLYGDMMTDGTIRQKAMEAVHNEKREELLLAELRAIKRKMREAKPFLREAKRQQKEAREEAAAILPSQKELRFIKAAAENMINQKKVRDISPNVYRVAEAKAGRIAFNAAAKGDYDVAYNAKLQQIRSHALYRAATKAKADSESIVRFLKKFQKKPLRQKLGKVDRLDQVDMLLDRYDLRKGSNKAINAANARLQLLTQIQQGLLTAPKSFTDSLQVDGKVNYRDETIEALRGLRDVLRQMRAEALNEYEMLVNNEKMRLNELADEMADTVLTTNKSVIPTYGELSAEEKMKEFGKSLVNAWLRTPSLARLLDNAQRGAWTRNIIEPVRRAVIEKLEPMKDKAQKDLAKLYSDHYSVKEMVRYNERVVIPGINMSLSKWDLLSLALNWGNAENRKAVLDSTVADRKPFTEEGVMRAFQLLDKRDWDFVQAAWSYVDSYWPEIKESQRRRRGISPPKVEADPFTVVTRDGQTITLAGGYYPLKYNPRLDARSRQNEIDDAFEKMRVGTMSSSQTKHGHTQERVGSGGQPVMLSMNVLHSHINNVIMDIALGDAVIYVDKVLRRKQIKQALIDTGNLDVLESFKLWLKDVATGELAPRSGGEQAARFIRLGFAKSKIGFNLVTVALQITGLPQTMVVTGKESFAKGAFEYAKNPRAAIRQVMSQSKMMHSRYELGGYNKEVQGVYEALGRKGAPASQSSSKFVRYFVALFNAVQIPPWLIHGAFYLMKQSQLQVDTITWLSGYEKAKAKDLPHDEAVAFADGVLENAQTSGMWNDRAPIERGTLSANTRQNEYVKLLTTLGSYMIAKGNIATERYKATDFKNIGQALGFAGDMMLLFSVEAILGAAIRGQWPEDDEDWWAWAALQSFKSAISTIPVAREFPSALEGFSTGGPLGSFVTDLAKATNQTLQGEIDIALFKAYSNVVGTLTGYPSSQLNRMVDAFWRESEGEDVPAYEYVTGRRN